MKRTAVRPFMALVVATTVFACTPADRRASEEEVPAEQHAAATVVPGSYEDWCGEHQVPESMCTRCNPALIAAFKATGDWCEEHALPESQCTICNPDLKIERPPKTASAP